MALASLCSKVQSFEMPPVTAFIVDHRLRPGSAAEAESVATNLQALGIQSEIINMYWPNHQNPAKLSNLETAARKLRFRLLGRACAKAGIDSLLLAHHGDDQAETVLSRIYAGYLGTGLQGIQAVSPIPECHGVYRVSESGSLRNLDPFKITKSVSVESGGVKIHRPLLDFTKAELIATCQTRQVDWHEDATNADKTLTARNAIRHLLGSRALPHALSTDSLRKLAANKLSHRRSCEDRATIMFKACKVELDIKTSSVSFSIHRDVRGSLTNATNPHLVAALLTRKFLSLSEDKHKLHLQDLSRAVEYLFPFLFKREPSKSAGVNIGNVTLLRTAESDEGWNLSDPRDPWKYSIFLRPVQNPEGYAKILLGARESGSDHDGPRWTFPTLFHDRWWIKLRYIPHNLPAETSMVVRFLKTTDLADMRAEDPGYLDQQLKLHASANTRFTLPAIVEISPVENADGSQSMVETVWALPTIGWKRAGFSFWSARRPIADQGAWQYIATYKSIDFEAKGRHTVKVSRPRKNTFKVLRFDQDSQSPTHEEKMTR